MDFRRLSTGDVLAQGINNKPVPETDIPTDRETFEGQSAEGWSYVGDEAVIAALEAGKVVQASNYYGIPHVWKAGDGDYRGVLLQYRCVTEDPTFTTASDAVEWFREMYYSTDG